ncbi:hypothetical protein [Streptomyces platensis]
MPRKVPRVLYVSTLDAASWVRRQRSRPFSAVLIMQATVYQSLVQ